MKLLALVLVLVMSGISLAQAAVWNDVNQWDRRWERTYSEWVKTNWTPDIFTNPQSPYYNISTDCADASYAMAIIFAYEHKLPFVMRDPTNYYGQGVISNRMNRWRGSELEKVRRFIDYVANIGSTRSLSHDTYPVAVNRNDFVGGIIYLAPGEHSLQVAELKDIGVPRILNSTVPKKVRTLEEFVNYPVYVPAGESGYKDGYRHFRRTKEELLTMVQDLPKFSTEQYDIARRVNYDHNEFSNEMVARLGVVKERIDRKASRLISNLCYYTQARIPVVDDALDYHARIGRRCMNASEYYDHSTPSRDKRLWEMFESILRLTHSSEFQSSNASIIDYTYAILYPEEAISERFEQKLKKFCPIEYAPGVTISLREFWRRLKNDAINSNPHAPLEARWGEVPYSSRCPVH